MSTYQSNVEREKLREFERKLRNEVSLKLADELAALLAEPPVLELGTCKELASTHAKTDSCENWTAAAPAEAEKRGAANQIGASMSEWMEAQRVTLDERQRWAVESFIVMNYLPAEAPASQPSAEREAAHSETWTAQVEPDVCDGKVAKSVKFYVSDKFNDWDVVYVTVSRVRPPAQHGNEGETKV